MRRVTLIVLLFLTLLITFSCDRGNQNTTYKTNLIRFDSVVIDSSIALTCKDNSPKCKIHMSLQYAIGNNAKAINNALLKSGILGSDYFVLSNQKQDIKSLAHSFVHQYINDYKETYGELSKQGLASKSLCTSYAVQTSTRCLRDGIVCYMVQITRNDGGTHPVEQTIVRNIELQHGKIVTLKDLFIKGSEHKLMNIVIQQMAKDKKKKNIEELRDISIFTGIDPYIPENFIIESKKITFIYCSDEIAPHHIGEIHVTLPNNQLKDLLK